MRLFPLFAFLACLVACFPLFAEESAGDSGSLKPYLESDGKITWKAYEPLTRKERWDLYLHDTFESPGPYLGALMSAAPIHSNPPMWGSEFEGYAARAGDNFARTVISNSIKALGAQALGEEVRYMPCECHGFFPRFGHALEMGFMTLNTQGHTVPALARIGGAFGSQFIGDVWMRDDYRTTQRALASVGFDLAIGSLVNVAREFHLGRLH